jgi:Mrp family chromosome partitioning ATPase
MPPGTGDVPLTVFQSLPVDGIVVVTSPQDLVGMIVEKAVRMAKMMSIPVVGIVENMAVFKCPDCGKEHRIFGEGKTAEFAKQNGIANVVSLPINPEFAKAVDAGDVESIEDTSLDVILESCMGSYED